VFDFCEDTSLEAYNALCEKISTLDISVLVNNVGMGDPVNRNTLQVYREIAVNCYPIVLLTQQLVGKFEERFSK
jgi:short-subunit dehydrogenase